VQKKGRVAFKRDVHTKSTNGWGLHTNGRDEQRTSMPSRRRKKFPKKKRIGMKARQQRGT